MAGSRSASSPAHRRSSTSSSDLGLRPAPAAEERPGPAAPSRSGPAARIPVRPCRPHSGPALPPPGGPALLPAGRPGPAGRGATRPCRPQAVRPCRPQAVPPCRPQPVRPCRPHSHLAGANDQMWVAHSREMAVRQPGVRPVWPLERRPGPCSRLVAWRDLIRGRSSVGRALDWQSRGSRVRVPSPPPGGLHVSRGDHFTFRVAVILPEGCDSHRTPRSCSRAGCSSTAAPR